MFAHIVSISLGFADVAHGRIIVLLFETIVDAILVLLDALGFLHAVQKRECGFGAGLGLHKQIGRWINGEIKATS